MRKVYYGRHNNYAVLRSIIDIIMKNGGEVMRMLAIISSLPLPVEE